MYKEDTVAEKKPTRKRKSRKKNIINDGVYAAISPASHKIGHLVNITAGSVLNSGVTSIGSLVFKYIDKDDKQTVVVYEKAIFLDNYGYYLGDIPINSEAPFLIEPPSVSVEEVDFSTLSLDHLMKIREMSMMFTELTFRQIFALDKFIREQMGNKRFTSMHLTVG
ncbi:MAG: hypothetical protein AB7U45_13290 [Desulfamplus sp.]